MADRAGLQRLFTTSPKLGLTLQHGALHLRQGGGIKTRQIRRPAIPDHGAVQGAVIFNGFQGQPVGLQQGRNIILADGIAGNIFQFHPAREFLRPGIFSGEEIGECHGPAGRGERLYNRLQKVIDVFQTEKRVPDQNGVIAFGFRAKNTENTITNIDFAGCALFPELA